MRTLITRISVSNYRGISHCEIDGLDRFNVFVGPNGVGKSSLQNALARFHPALCGWPALFRDGDFRFTGPSTAPSVKLEYDFQLLATALELSELDVGEPATFDDQDGGISAIRCRLRVCGSRAGTGTSMGALNAGTPADDQSELFVFDNETYRPASELLATVRNQAPILNRISMTGSVDPIRPPEDEAQKQFIPVKTFEFSEGRANIRHGRRAANPSHAATVEYANTSADALRARLVQVLSKGDKADAVNRRHPSLVGDTIVSFNKLRGFRDIVDITITDSEELFFERTDGSWVLWRNFSAGETALFGFCWMEAMAQLEDEPTLLVEEPENSIHVGQQREMLRNLVNYAKDSQVFLSTHSTSFLEIEQTGLFIRHWLLSKADGGIEVNNVTNLVPTSVLTQVGMTARSIGQPRFRFLVEGLSDAVFFQVCLEKLLVAQLSIDSARDLVEFVICGGPAVTATHGASDEAEFPGPFPQDLLDGMAYKLNLARTGVERQYILFDSDRKDEESAVASADALRERFPGSSQVVVIKPWYRTLENLYTTDLWDAALPNSQILNKVEPQMQDGSKRLWASIEEIMKWTLRKPLSKSTIKTRKVSMAFNVASRIRDGSWVEENKNTLSGLIEVSDDILERVNAPNETA